MHDAFYNTVSNQTGLQSIINQRSNPSLQVLKELFVKKKKVFHISG